MAQTREQFTEQLVTLRHDRGDSILAKPKFNCAAIAEIKHRLQTLDSAKDRETETACRPKRREQLREDITKLETKRLQAWQDAEVAARRLVQCLSSVISVSQEEASVLRELMGSAVPARIQRAEVSSRIGGRIASVMATIPGHRARMGAIEWRGGSSYPPDQNWREQEEKALGSEINAVIGQG